MPHLESKTKLIMTASVNWYINPICEIMYSFEVFPLRPPNYT